MRPAFQDIGPVAFWSSLGVKSVPGGITGKRRRQTIIITSSSYKMGLGIEKAARNRKQSSKHKLFDSPPKKTVQKKTKTPTLQPVEGFIQGISKVNRNKKKSR